MLTDRQRQAAIELLKRQLNDAEKARNASVQALHASHEGTSIAWFFHTADLERVRDLRTTIRNLGGIP